MPCLPIDASTSPSGFSRGGHHSVAVLPFSTIDKDTHKTHAASMLSHMNMSPNRLPRNRFDQRTTFSEKPGALYLSPGSLTVPQGQFSPRPLVPSAPLPPVVFSL